MLYKKVNNNMSIKVNKEGKRFAKDAKVLNKMKVNSRNNSFITLKDHKENYEDNLKTRLINPAKNEIGRSSKVILDKINKDLCTKLGANQWKNTASVINWLKCLNNKQAYKFCMFDIKDFYPSIKGPVLQKKLCYSRKSIRRMFWKKTSISLCTQEDHFS